MQATCFLKMSVDFQETIWRYIPQGRKLHNHHCENLKSYIWIQFIKFVSDMTGLVRCEMAPAGDLGLKFSPLPRRNLRAWMWTFYGGTRNACIIAGTISVICYLQACWQLLAMSPNAHNARWCINPILLSPRSPKDSQEAFGWPSGMYVLRHNTR
jgi:hypothetical protein